jgi:ubiquinone/menaquinone biosynthesis C-methylase UbiE
MFGRRREAPAPPHRDADWRSFDEVAETYDRVRAPVHAAPARDLVEAMGPPAPQGFLDAGSGTGVLAETAREAGWDPVVGVDRSEPMLALARRRIDRLVAADAVDLPFADGRFAVVGSSFVLHTFPKHETALFDLLRVIRPGGLLGTATWAGGDDEFTRTWRTVAESYATKELLADATRRAAPGMERFADPGRLEETLREAGLREVDVARREYRSSTSIADYLAGRETTALGRFLRSVLGEALWERFRARVDDEFRNRFPDPIGDSYEVLIAVGKKPA